MKVGELFNPLLDAVSNEKFLDCRLAQNETPHYILPFDPAEQEEMESVVVQLGARLKQRGIASLAINVYDVALSQLDKMGDLQWNLENEATAEDRGQFYEDLAGQVDPTKVLLPEIKRRVAASEARLVLVSGVGACYRLFRPGALFNGFKDLDRRLPVVIFFPGDYSVIPGVGSSLHLFNNPEGERFYRAFDLRNHLNDIYS